MASNTRPSDTAVVKLGIRIPAPLHAALVKMAEKDRRSLHNLIIVTLEEAARADGSYE